MGVATGLLVAGRTVRWTYGTHSAVRQRVIPQQLPRADHANVSRPRRRARPIRNANIHSHKRSTRPGRGGEQANKQTSEDVKRRLAQRAQAGQLKPHRLPSCATCPASYEGDQSLCTAALARSHLFHCRLPSLTVMLPTQEAWPHRCRGEHPPTWSVGKSERSGG